MALVKVRTEIEYKAWTAPLYVRQDNGSVEKSTHVKDAAQEVIDALAFQFLQDLYTNAEKKCPFRHQAVPR